MTATPYFDDPPVAQFDEPATLAALVQALRAIHGPTYDFAAGHWGGPTDLEPQRGRVRYRFVVAAADAGLDLHPGDWVRGAPGHGP